MGSAETQTEKEREPMKKTLLGWVREKKCRLLRAVSTSQECGQQSRGGCKPTRPGEDQERKHKAWSEAENTKEKSIS